MKFFSKLILFRLIFLFNQIIDCKLFNGMNKQSYFGLKKYSDEVANLTLQKKQKNNEFSLKSRVNKREIDFKIDDVDFVKEIESQFHLPPSGNVKPKKSSKSSHEHKQKLLKILKKIIKNERVKLKNNVGNSTINSSTNITTSRHEAVNNDNDSHTSSEETTPGILYLNKMNPQTSPKKQNQSAELLKERITNNTRDKSDLLAIGDLEKSPLLVIDAANHSENKGDMKVKETLNSTTFQQRFGEVSTELEENFSHNLHSIKSENILKQIANNFQSPMQEIRPLGPLADLSLWLRPMNSQKNFLLNSTLSVDENPILLQESPLKAVDAADKYSTSQLLLDNYLKPSALQQNPIQDTNQFSDFAEVINLLQKLDASNNDVKLPVYPYDTKFIGSPSNADEDSVQMGSNPFSSASFSNFSQDIGDGIPPEVLGNLLVRLRVPTAQEIASVLPNTTAMITPQLSTAFANLITNLSNAIAQFITEVQAALMMSPLLGVLLALALIAIVWHIFEKKKKGYGYGYGHGHHGGGYHRREDDYPNFRTFNSHGIDILVNVLKSLNQFEKRFKTSKL